MEALEFVVCDTPGLTGVQLQDLKLKRTCCFAVLTVAEILLPEWTGLPAGGRFRDCGNDPSWFKASVRHFKITAT